MKRAPAKPIQLSPEQLQKLESAVFEVVESALARRFDDRFYLLGVSFEKEAGYWFLRVYVESQDRAISLSDCELISRELDPVIEGVSQLKDLSYSLEISSPGLFRPLSTQRELDFYIGEPVRIEDKPPAKLKKGLPLPASSCVYEGTLIAADATRSLVTLQSEAGGPPFEITLSDQQILLLNPVLRFPEGLEDAPDETFSASETP